MIKIIPLLLAVPLLTGCAYFGIVDVKLTPNEIAACEKHPFPAACRAGKREQKWDPFGDLFGYSPYD